MFLLEAVQRVGLWSVVLFASCAEGPPSLPGENEPWCELEPLRSFLVRKLNPGTALSVDISYPPDGENDTDRAPYFVLHAAVPQLLDDALTRALAQHQILWVISTQRCLSGAYVRASLRRGVGFSESAPLATVQVADEPFTWSVGTIEDDVIDVHDGIGTVPFAAPFDAAADVSPTAWFPAYSVLIHGQLVDSVMIGEVALAGETARMEPEAIAAATRTLQAAQASEPSCPPTCSSLELQGVIQLTDQNDDRVFARQEVHEALSLFGFWPYLDLLVDGRDPITTSTDCETRADDGRDGSPVFWPGHDHICESLGVGYDFEAVEVRVAPAD